MYCRPLFIPVQVPKKYKQESMFGVCICKVHTQRKNTYNTEIQTRKKKMQTRKYIHNEEIHTTQKFRQESLKKQKYTQHAHTHNRCRVCISKISKIHTPKKQIQQSKHKKRKKEIYESIKQCPQGTELVKREKVKRRERSEEKNSPARN